MWQPPLPNNGKVKVRYRYSLYDVNVEDFEIERYRTLVIRPITSYQGTRCRFRSLYIDDALANPTPMLFLDENVSKVVIEYVVLDYYEFGAVVDEITSVGLSLENYLPQVTLSVLTYNSIPRGTIYAGVIFEGTTFNQPVFAFPVDLDKNEFKMELNSVIYTLRLNRSKKIENNGVSFCLFDVIKGEFGEGLPESYSESFVELKPKGE